MSLVGTRSSLLTVYVAVHGSWIHDIGFAVAIKPKHVMSVTAHRSWVPLHVQQSAAVSRAPWGCEEMGISVSDPKKELLVLQIRFSPFCVGHFLMHNVLTTRDWKQFRFYGALPLRCFNHDGQTVMKVGNNVFAIE